MSKLIQAAIAAKLDGYEYLSSVVKGYKASVYHHYVDIDRVIAAGKWIPAGYAQFANGGTCRSGVTAKNIPGRHINKSRAIAAYCK